MSDLDAFDELDLEDHAPAKKSGRISYASLLIKQGTHKLYTLAMPSEILAETCTVDRADDNPLTGFQRNLDERRAREIAYGDYPLAVGKKLLYKKPEPIKEEIPVTVCIAAMSGRFIFGIADRMITADDIQYEPPAPKILPLTSSIVLMTAGNASFQAEVVLDVYKWINEKITKHPDKWMVVKDVAYMYARCHNLVKSVRAENAILTPLGLNKESFVARQHEMSEGFITSITREMLTYEVPSISAIIAGSDEFGSHIYTVHGDSVNCMNAIGFASIGIGSRHADSQFMQGRHSNYSLLPEMLLLAYAAKKRSEISPGVGKEEDYFFIGDTLGSLNMTPNPEIIKKLKQEYAKVAKKEVSVLESAKKEVQRHVEELSKAPPPKPQKVAEPLVDGNVREESIN